MSSKFAAVNPDRVVELDSTRDFAAAVAARILAAEGCDASLIENSRAFEDLTYMVRETVPNTALQC